MSGREYCGLRRRRPHRSVAGPAVGKRDALFKSAIGSLPVGRVGEPEDVAEAYLYLMRGGYSTGSVVVVDGGTARV